MSDDLYAATSYELAEKLTNRYSTSFSMSSRLFGTEIRPHIYAVYGMVRLADEIVDTYRGDDAASRLQALEDEVSLAVDTGYSVNPIVHAYALTAQKFNIDQQLVRAFYDSMRMDLNPLSFTQEVYEKYIHGSAEAVGLMCLWIFVGGDESSYERLAPGASALGAAYQKVNFLRDMRDDYKQLGRVYFPGVDFLEFDDDQKHAIEADIEQDFALARATIPKLPRSARSAVLMSYEYYYALLDKLKKSSAETIKTRRVKTSDGYKMMLLARRSIIR